MIFEPTPEESKSITKWVTEHKNYCRLFKTPTSSGAIGGALSYTFTPTSIGTMVKVSCVCGQESDRTDYQSW